MRKAKNLIGLRAISQHEGKDLGKIHDLLFSSTSRQLLGLLMHERDLFGLKDATAIHWSQVQQIGKDAVMISSPDAVVKVHSDDLLAEAYDNELTLTSKQLTTDRGETLGKVSDLYLDDSGHVVGYEVSGGLFSDAYDGRRYLDAPANVIVGKDVILMPHQIVDDLNRQMQEQPGGIKGALSSAGETLSDTYDSAKESVTSGYEDLAGASVEKQREYVIGKTAGTDVILPADRAANASPATLAESHVESGQNPNAPAAGELALGDFGNRDSAGGIDIEPVRANSEALVPVAHESEALVPVADQNEALVPSHQSASAATASQMQSANQDEAIVPSNQTPQPQETVTELQKSTPATATDINSQGEVVNGEVLVRQGETITAEQADRAINAGVLAQLVASASAGSARNSQTNAQTQGALSNARQSAEDAAIGKPSAFEVDAPDGSVLVAPGQIVTRELLARADAHGKKAQVVAAAGAGAVSQSAQNVYAEAKDVAGNVWDTVKEKAEQLIGYTKDKKNEYDEATLERKIKDAVGRPVTRVILAPDDTVILNTGDIITNKAIEEARRVDYVDMILDSVYQTEPEITPEMMRAKGEGDATLATQAQPTGGPITATVEQNRDDQN